MYCSNLPKGKRLPMLESFVPPTLLPILPTPSTSASTRRSVVRFAEKNRPKKPKLQRLTSFSSWEVSDEGSSNASMSGMDEVNEPPPQTVKPGQSRRPTALSRTTSFTPTWNFNDADIPGYNDPPSASSYTATSTASLGREYDPTGWGDGWEEDWDPAAGIDQDTLQQMEQDAERQFRRKPGDEPRDKWITPLLDWRAIREAFDPDQERTEMSIQTEALTNQDESQTALVFLARIVAIPVLTGFIVSRALAGPVLEFTLENNPEAFAMTERQKLEGAKTLHLEETRIRMDMAIGRVPMLSEDEVLEHLHDYALEVQEEERHHNEQNLVTIISDSVALSMFVGFLSQPTEGRRALATTIQRLFTGLSDIAKAVLLILVADTVLGYHSEEGWTAFIDIVLLHYGVEAEEEAVAVFVGVVPVVIDVFFKYWIFVGLNKISPGAVVTIKQIERH